MRGLITARWLPIATFVATAWLTEPGARADVPDTMTHQGRLFQANGFPVTGTQTMNFVIYDAANAGAELWTETHDVAFDEGFFSVRLGGLSQLDAVVLDGSVRWLGVTVGADPEMTPRAAIASVPYAMFAGDVRGVINPQSVNIQGNEVIDASGQWVGDPTGLQGPPGPPGPAGPSLFKRATYSVNIPPAGQPAVQMASITITPPVAGTAVVRSRGWCNMTAINGSENGINVATGTTLANAFSGFLGDWGVIRVPLNSPTGGTYQQMISTESTFPVAADVAATFVLAGRHEIGNVSNFCTGTMLVEVYTGTLP
jgi:hypothetical protein